MLALINRLPESLRYKVLFFIGTSTTPLLRYLRARLIELTPERATVRINLSRRSKNHANTMFWGAITSGADCAAAVFPMKYMFETGHSTSPMVMHSSTKLHKRVKSYALFTCNQGREIYEACDAAVATGKPQELTIELIVTAPGEYGDEIIGRVSQVTSIKNVVRK